MTTYAVYYSPADYPRKWVVRRLFAFGGMLIPSALPDIVADSLDAARSVIPFGLIRFGRNLQDKFSIWEAWL